MRRKSFKEMTGAFVLTVFGFSAAAQVSVGVGTMKVSEGTSVYIPNSGNAVDLSIQSNGALVNNGDIVLASGANLQENSDQTGLGVIAGTGTITTTANLNAPSEISPGNLGFKISSANNLGLTTIKRGHDAYNIGVGFSVQRWYQILPSDTAGISFDVELAYDQSELNNNVEVDLNFAQSVDSGSSWVLSAAAQDTANNVLTRSGLTAAGMFSFVTTATVLPLQLLSFNASVVNNQSVFIEWQTSHEKNMDRYIVMRSADGIVYEPVEEVLTTGVGRHHYSVTDGSPFTGTSYYKLKQVEVGGHVYDSDIEVVVIKRDVRFELYPNPVTSVLNVRCNSDDAIHGYMCMYNASGVLIRRVRTDLAAGTHVLKIDVSALNSGVYFVSLMTPSGITDTKKIMVQ
mgnify:CR=1 FL=1